MKRALHNILFTLYRAFNGILAIVINTTDHYCTILVMITDEQY